jgi:hypothetical protein
MPAMPEPLMSDATRVTAGVLLVTIVAVESGGLFMLRVVGRHKPATPFQTAFFRAGHAHAGVLVTLALASQLFVDAAALGGLVGSIARSGIALAAILMPAGFFLSAWATGATKPNRLIVLVYLGAVALAAGALSLGLGLLLGS